MTENNTVQPTSQSATPNQIIDYLKQFADKISGPTGNEFRTYDRALENLRETLFSQERNITGLQTALDLAMEDEHSN